MNVFDLNKPNDHYIVMSTDNLCMSFIIRNLLKKKLQLYLSFSIFNSIRRFSLKIKYSIKRNPFNNSNISILYIIVYCFQVTQQSGQEVIRHALSFKWSKHACQLPNQILLNLWTSSFQIFVSLLNLVKFRELSHRP